MSWLTRFLGRKDPIISAPTQRQLADPVLAVRYASDLIARSVLAAQVGKTFGGKRDLYAALGYPRTITLQEQRETFERGGIGARIVDAYPSATWRGGATLVEDENPTISTPFEEDWDALVKDLNVWSIFKRADILAGLGHYSGIIIGAVGEMEAELPSMSTPEDVLFLMPYAEDALSVDTTVSDVQDERYGLPEFYKLKGTSRKNKTNPAAGSGADKKVHWTRVVHVADGLLDDPVYGSPRLERVWNYLADLDKVVGGGSEAFWQRVNRGMVFNIDPGVEITPEQITSLEERAEELAHQMRRTMGARGMKVQDLGSEISNFDKPVQSIISLISGATGIPQRILLGSERGELASTQDKENWNERVTDRQRDFGEPLVRAFVDRLIEYGALPEPGEEGYQVAWPDIEELTEKEKAEVVGTLSGVNKKIGKVIIKASEIRDKYLGLEPLTEAEENEDVPSDQPPVAPGTEDNAPDAVPGGGPEVEPELPTEDEQQ